MRPHSSISLLFALCLYWSAPSAADRDPHQHQHRHAALLALASPPGAVSTFDGPHGLSIRAERAYAKDDDIFQVPSAALICSSDGQGTRWGHEWLQALARAQADATLRRGEAVDDAVLPPHSLHPSRLRTNSPYLAPAPAWFMDGVTLTLAMLERRESAYMNSLLSRCYLNPDLLIMRHDRPHLLSSMPEYKHALNTRPYSLPHMSTSPFFHAPLLPDSAFFRGRTTAAGLRPELVAHHPIFWTERHLDALNGYVRTYLRTYLAVYPILRSYPYSYSIFHTPDFQSSVRKHLPYSP